LAIETVFGIDEPSFPSQALDLFEQKTGMRQKFWVDLSKRVPAGGGLGGGSGNAATALWAANKLTGEQATESQLLVRCDIRPSIHRLHER